MNFNINDKVKVKLTNYGRSILITKAAKFRSDFPQIVSAYQLPEEIDGWSSWQLWQLMETFGEYMTLGGDLPFETTIKIGEKR